MLFDIVDVGREYLTLFPCVSALDALMNATTLPDLKAAGSRLSTLLEDLDGLLDTHAGFRLGGWLEEARLLGVRGGASPSDMALLNLNARALVTTWFPDRTAPKGGGGTDSLYDYANKMWSGVVGVYYSQRYSALEGILEAALINGGKPNSTAFSEKLGALGVEFITSTTPVNPRPTGDTLQLAAALWEKYAQT